MRINLSESKIHKIVLEILNRFILKETFTNMKQLYHETTIDNLFNMIRVNSFFLMPSNHSGRGGKYYASLSRHKYHYEGFNSLAYASNDENFIESYATITFNIPKLTRVHGISIRPFDFYGTYAKERTHHEYIPRGHGHGHGHGHGNDDGWDVEGVDDFDNGVYSKVIYQRLKKGYDNWTDEEDDEMGLYSYDDPEYYNMAEENIVSDTVKEIPEIFNYIDKIDVFFPADLIIDKNRLNDDYYDNDVDAYKRSYQYAYALCKIVLGTPWENKIAVNLTKNDGGYKDKPIKTMPISDFFEWIKQEENYGVHSKNGERRLSIAPKSRDKKSTYGSDDETDDDSYYENSFKHKQANNRHWNSHHGNTHH